LLCIVQSKSTEINWTATDRCS